MGNIIFVKMRTIVYITLIFFGTFLIAPTVVSVINKSCDTSSFYNIVEEELTHKAVKEIKAPLINDHYFKLAKLTSSIIISENQLKHDAVTPTIFSPPPNA